MTRALYMRPRLWPAATDEAIVFTLFACDVDWRLYSPGRTEPVMMALFRRWVSRHRAAAALAFYRLKREQNAVTPDADLFRLLFNPPTSGFVAWVQKHRPSVWAAYQACADVHPENNCPKCGRADQVLVCEIQGSYCQRCGGKTWITP